MENEGALDVSFAGGRFQRRREQCTITAGFGNPERNFRAKRFAKIHAVTSLCFICYCRGAVALGNTIARRPASGLAGSCSATRARAGNFATSEPAGRGKAVASGCLYAGRERDSLNRRQRQAMHHGRRLHTVRLRLSDRLHDVGRQIGNRDLARRFPKVRRELRASGLLRLPHRAIRQVAGLQKWPL